MPGKSVLTVLAAVAVLASAPQAVAQGSKTEVDQVSRTDRRDAEEVPQLGLSQDREAAEEVRQIAPGQGSKVLIDPLAGQLPKSATVNQSGGRDLCDPTVSEAERRRAGVDCSERIRIERKAVTGLAEDPLLQPPEDFEDGFDALDLGDDVPATVILQQ